MPFLECVPNLSEGRSPERVARLVRAVRVPGVALLDGSSDPDHHRSVLTLAGEAGALLRGLLELYRTAIEEIDLTVHRGAHPRIGAVDVTPFVPLEGVVPCGGSMADAVAAARRLARAVGRDLDIPAFLYAKATPGETPRRPADLRRGGLPGLEAQLADGLAPDSGPRKLHPRAGATLIGARTFLIAVNAVLDGEGGEALRAARRVARSVRASSGGLPAVQALGLALPSRSRAQVSMNLLDVRRTSLHTLLSTVAREAQARGSRVAEVEIVGLVPRGALEDGPEDAFWRPFVGEDRVLESRLRQAGLGT